MPLKRGRNNSMRRVCVFLLCHRTCQEPYLQAGSPRQIMAGEKWSVQPNSVNIYSSLMTTLSLRLQISCYVHWKIRKSRRSKPDGQDIYFSIRYNLSPKRKLEIENPSPSKILHCDQHRCSFCVLSSWREKGTSWVKNKDVVAGHDYCYLVDE